MKKFVVFALFVLLVMPSSMKAGVEDLIINEIQVANIDGFIDPSYNYGGWVELYNPTDAPIGISNLYISEDASNLKMFKMPSGAGSVPAYSFKNIWFDHYDTGNKYSSVASRQVDFKLNYEGGTIYISDLRGNLLISQDFPAAVQRCSYARTTDGGDEWRMCSTPTPAASNIGSTFADEQLPMPEVDTDAKVFTVPFSFNVAIPAGATLRYTTDGSTPTLTNGMMSSNGHFIVNNTSVVYRFRLFQDGYLPSSVVTRSFIYKDKDYYLPIVSVVTDDANLYDDKIGAYTVGTNGISGQGVSYTTNKNRSWERPVNFEYLVPDDDGGSFLMALNQECDFEVCGGWSRSFQPNASFRLKGGRYYLGQTYLPYAFFKEKPYIKSKGVVVRNGGNDNYGRIRDAGTHKIILSSGFYVDCQEWQPVHVFINGKFQFSFNLREPNNKNHGYANYGIDTDEMDQFEINGSKGYEQKTGDDQAFRRWMSLATQLGSNPTNSSLYDQICELVDIDEYSNYMAAECYVGCGDWLTNSNNVKGYRDRNDGKFHLVFMDLDSGFGSTNMLGSLAGKLNDSRYDTGKNFLIDIFLNMLKHEPFKKRFIDAFCLVDGSVFESERSKEIVYAMRDYQMKAMEFESHGNDLNNSANTLINGINNGRSGRMSNFRNYFGLSNPITLQLSSNIEGAAILANGQEVPTGKFNGSMQAPMTLTAKGPAGYRFLGWQMEGEGSMVLAGKVFSTGDTWFYYDQGSLDGTDWKAVNYSTSTWRSGNAPFGYGNIGISGSQDYATTLDYGSDANNKRPTYYFRKTFRLSDEPTATDAYVLKGYVDDGCVVYVNGHEVGRYLMPDGTIAYETFSTTYAGSTAGQCSFTIDNQLLHSGSNVIAVEIHNTHEHSSDIYWTAELLHNTMGENSVLTTEPQLVLDSYAGQDLSNVVATYEPLPDNALLADIATPVKVNEVSAGNSIFVNEFFKKNDWFELYNATDVDINAAGLYVSDDIYDPLKYQIPSTSAINTIIPAHGHLILWADKLEATTQLHTDFKLGNNDGEMVLVTSSSEFVDNNAAYFDAHPLLKDFADALVYTSHASDQTVGRYPDGGNTFYQMFRPSIGRPNASTSYDILSGQDEGIMSPVTSTFLLDLVDGWNWISHPMTDAVQATIFADYANSILGPVSSVVSLSPATMYKVQMNGDHTFEINGTLCSQPTSLNLSAGWNWIGYPCEGTQTIATAFAEADIDEGDIIVGQSGFAVYSAADGWVGTLSSLAAGSGYLYMSKSAKELSFASAATMVKWRKPKHHAPRLSPLTPCDRHVYPDIMPIIGQLQLGEDLVENADYTLAAYVGDECRGVGELIADRFFITVYGNDGETLTFKAFDEVGEEHTITDELTFDADVLGTWNAPYLFSLFTEPDHINQPSSLNPHPSAQGYYTLSGLYVASRSDQLRPGLYILRNRDGSSRKVLIKK